MLRGARLVWSMWGGYLDADSGAELQRWAASRDIVVEAVHASGHVASKIFSAWRLQSRRAGSFPSIPTDPRSSQCSSTT